MQELVTSIYAAGGRVVVIDDGYSFKNTVEILGGTFVGFDGSVQIRLNPFSMLSAEDMEKDEYRADAIELVTGIIASMAALGEGKQSRVEEFEEGRISRIVADVWGREGRGRRSDGRLGAASRIRGGGSAARRCGGEARGVHAERSLRALLRGACDASGSRRPSRSSSSPTSRGRRCSRTSCCRSSCFWAPNSCSRRRRAVPVAILIDEAWDLLKSHATARFIEGVVRRARKYNRGAHHRHAVD
uniref:TraG/VirB4 family ATPase n=1 Tax=Cereibacter sphaeroides TaxID=1063 RepID=UPI0021566324|nr:hypothetical protein [Cereibacter sphaeroides]